MQPGKKLTVLLIDDDRIYQFTTQKGMQVANLSVNIISYLNGADAFEYIEKAAKHEADVPGIIFLDINMPVMNGIEFLEAFEGIKDKFTPEIPIYVVSSSADSRDTDAISLFSTVKGYLVKPVQQQKFVEILTSVMNL